jgi:hypothetical protein
LVGCSYGSDEGKGEVPADYGDRDPRAKYRLKKEPSVITFGRKLYDDLVTEEGRQPQDMDLSRLLTLRFLLAVMLTHEVVHALRYAADGDLRMDVFLGTKAVLSERRFELEARLFGGRFEMRFGDEKNAKYALEIHKKSVGAQVASTLVGVPVIWDWSERLVSAPYYKEILSLWRRNDRETRMHENDVAWRIQVEAIAR